MCVSVLSREARAALKNAIVGKIVKLSSSVSVCGVCVFVVFKNWL